MKKKIYIVPIFLLYQFFIVSASSGSWEWSGSGSGDPDNNNTEDEANIEEETGNTRSNIAPPTTRSSGPPSFDNIVKESVKVLSGELGTPVELRKMLDKYYFTGKKSQSIWPKAIEETKKTFGYSYSERDLSDIQAFIRNIYRNMMYCDEKLTKRDQEHRVKHAECYETLYEIVTEGTVDFGFPSGSNAGIARILNLNIAFNLMRLLYLELTQQLALIVGLQPMSTTKHIYTVAEDVVSKYSSVGPAVVDARVNQVSAVEICSVQEIFFKEFTDTCQSASSKDPGNLIVAGGTSKDPFQIKFRAKVIDRKNDKEVCNVAMMTDPRKDADTVRKELKKKCEKMRKTYVDELSKNIKAYLVTKSDLVSKELPLLWRRKEKTLKKLKAELDNKISRQKQTKTN